MRGSFTSFRMIDLGLYSNSENVLKAEDLVFIHEDSC
jgi:hypothetical protein